VKKLSDPRDPIEITNQLLKFIDENGKASRWDLTKILGNTRQVNHWIDGFLLKDKFIDKITNENVNYYRLTDNGRLLLNLVKKGNVMRSIFRLSGKRLRRYY
jgi:predicted transcriptional regulator